MANSNMALNSLKPLCHLTIVSIFRQYCPQKKDNRLKRRFFFLISTKSPDSCRIARMILSDLFGGKCYIQLHLFF